VIIIGEKLNGAIPAVAEAIRNRDIEKIKSLALAQEQAGADYLDVCAGTESALEYDALVWLIDVIQSSSQLPICIDSPNPDMLLKIIPSIKNPGIINSISGEGKKCELLFPFLKEKPGWKVIALTCDDAGIPSDAGRKTENALLLIEKAKDYDIAPDRIFIDPLVLAVSAIGDSMLQFMEAIQNIKAKYPTVHFTSGLSNISYAMPARGLINRNFLALAMSAGMDSAIMDPTNKIMMENVYAVEVLLGKDRLCREYNKAYRSGIIGTKK
jgi:5-methyltetrahydrofolate--homocysteine methyltransferase